MQPIGLERRRSQQGRPHRNRPQIGVDLQELPQREQARLGAQLARRALQRGIANGPEQHSVAVDDRVARHRRQWIVGQRDARRADGIPRELEAEVEALADRL